MRCKKLMGLFFICIFLISVAEAMEWDNTKNFINDSTTSRYGKIEINNWLGIGETLATYELIDNSDSCLTFCYAEGTANLSEKGILFSGIEFKDRFGDLKSLSNVKIFVYAKTPYDVEIPTYKEVCTGEENKTECTYEIIDSIKETQYRDEWVEYGGQELEGFWRWRIEANKNLYDSIDWVASSKGVSFTDWAWWSNDWSNCKNLTITTSLNQAESIMLYNITSITFTNTSEIRIINAPCNSNGAEIKSSVLSNNSDWAYVTFLANLSGSNAIYSIYYNNSNNPAKSLDAILDYCEFGSEDGSVCGWNNVSSQGFITPEGTYNATATSGFNSWQGFISSIDLGVNVGIITSRFNYKTMDDAYTVFGLTSGAGLDMFSTAPFMGSYSDTRNSYKEISLYNSGGDEITYTPSNVTYQIFFKIASNGNMNYTILNDSGTVLNSAIATKNISVANLSLGIGASGSTWVGALMWDYLRAYTPEGAYVSDLDMPTFTLGSEEVGELDTSAPYFTTIPNNDSITYNTYWTGVSFEASDSGTFDCFAVNDSNFIINCSGYLNQTSNLLGVGIYVLNITINDSLNNLNSTEYQLTINQADPSTNMQLTGTTPLSYPQQTDVSASETNTGDGGCSYSVDASNGVYGVGTITFNYSTTGCTNYTQGSVTKDIVISQNNTLELGITGTSPISYPQLSDIAGSSCPVQLSCSLDKSNLVYGVDASPITFNYSTAGNSNYSASSITFELTITQNDTYVLGISGTSPLEYPNPTDVIGSLCPSELSCSLDKSNLVYGVGVSPVTFNFSSEGNINYSANSITLDIQINKNSTYVLGISGTSPIVYGTATDVSGSNCPSELSCALDKANGIYPVGITTFNYSTNGDENYTENSDVLLIEIEQNNSLVNLSFDLTSPQVYETSIIPNCSLITGEGEITLELNGVIINNLEPIIIGAGNNIFNCSYLETENYTSYEDLGIFEITQKPTNTYLYLNNLSSDASGYNGSLVNISARTDGLIEILETYVDATVINQNVGVVENLTYFNDVGIFNISAVYLGNDNYSGSQVSYILNISLEPSGNAALNSICTGFGEGAAGFISMGIIAIIIICIVIVMTLLYGGDSDLTLLLVVGSISAFVIIALGYSIIKSIVC